MPDIRPLRDLSEHDVFNGFYRFDGILPQQKGIFVTIGNSGWSPEAELGDLTTAGASYDKVVSQRVGLTTDVRACTATGDNALGVLLYDVRETDENDIPLRFDPAKQARMQCNISGQSCVIAQRGKFLYSGVNGSNVPVVGVTVGAPAYLAADGGISTSGSHLDPTACTKVGKFLGIPNAQGWVLVDIQL
jgi:hypothetical protein